MIQIHALKDLIESGEQSYPIYLALLRADVINDIAAVPSYRDTTTNADVARNVSTRPVKEWQRPKISDKVESIRQLFNDTGEFMPNPILIGENPNASVGVEVKPYLVAGNETPAWELLIEESSADAEKPLWILDGQHRIAGLAASAQSSNPVPVVFLLNQGSPYYGADKLAEIFAQVTTSATQLGPLHREWLSYAFDLNHYSLQANRPTEQKKAMEAVVALCKTPSFDGQANPFHDRIQFIDGLASAGILPGGHVYDCIELKETVRRRYYGAQKTKPELSPEEVARQMCLARTALASVIRTPVERSVFFGDEAHHQKIMEDAFWSGALRLLALHGAPRSWRDVLRKLHFDSTSWDFSWKRSLHGREQSRSKALAIKVMEDIFANKELPEGSDNIADLLQGNGAGFVLEAFSLTPAGYRSSRRTKEQRVSKGDSRSFAIEPCVGIRIREPSLNIQEIEVTDKQAPPGRLVPYSREVLRNAGMLLDGERHNNPLQLLFTLIHYGGVTSAADVHIDWQP